jgi:hypothetical protein
MQCRFRIRLNGGFVAGFLRLNAYAFAHPSSLFLFIFLSCLLFLFLMQFRFRFRLNGGFVAGFLRLNAYGFSVPFLSVLLVPFLFFLSVYFSFSYLIGLF